MTNQEKQALSLKIATLADTMLFDPTLLWEADSCPKRHNLEDFSGEYSIGDLCPECLEDHDAFGLVPNTYWRRDKTKEWCPEWHPDWRIGRKPKDMTNPAVLLLVIQAWIAQTPKRRSERIEWIKECQEWRVVFFEYEEVPLCLTVFRSHTDRTTAEALALLGVLEEDWGDENG